MTLTAVDAAIAKVPPVKRDYSLTPGLPWKPALPRPNGTIQTFREKP